MDQLTIEPKKGIGNIKLGMTEAEVEECLQYYTDRYEITYEKNPECYHAPGTIRRSFSFEYDADGKVTFIQIVSSLQDVLACVFQNMDVFRTKAEELIPEIDNLSRYDRDHSELGYTYEFPELGLSFWRSNILTEADLQAEWFQELRPEIQEDEKKFLYFECASIRSV